ncbi:MAG: DUF2493 domain-containing protein [Candidatus Riesia sp.]|nr:DUF2493 domain-containing protein [Candidatus Riesia sp.]
MKTIIAGGRNITKEQFDTAIGKFPYLHYITEVVSGQAYGVDTFGEEWAKYNKIPIKPFPAEWRNFDLPMCVVKTNKFGYQYNAAAGAYRNKLMAEYADQLILIYDGKSTGSSDMLQRAKQNNLKIWIYDTSDDFVFTNM